MHDNNQVSRHELLAENVVTFNSDSVIKTARGLHSEKTAKRE